MMTMMFDMKGLIGVSNRTEDEFESDTDRLPDVHVQQLLPLGGEEEGEAKRGSLAIIIVIEMVIIIIFMIVIERSREASCQQFPQYP